MAGLARPGVCSTPAGMFRRKRRQPDTTPADAALGNGAGGDKPGATQKKKRRSVIGWTVHKLGWLLLFLVVVIACARPFMPRALRWYVNRTLDKSEVYRGRIGDVDIHLWKGAYSIHDVQLNKLTGDVPVPLFAGKRVDFAMQWDAIVHGKLVGRMYLEQPELNFVDAPDAADAQTGVEGPWLQIIRDLFPFKINSAVVHEGSVHFRTFAKAEPVDVYLSQFNASVDNLTNIRDETAPMPTTVTATAMAMDQARFEYQMKFDPFSYYPSFHLATRLLGLDVTKVNNLALAYGAFDFKRGYFDLVVEVDAKEGQLRGYVKPLFRDLRVFSLKQDIQERDVLGFFWQAIVGGVTQVLKNQPRDQFGTLIPFTGTVDTPQPAIFTTVVNVLRNAFIRAYLPRLQDGQTGVEGMEFGPADFGEITGDQP